jgi:hypothetical protein
MSIPGVCKQQLSALAVTEAVAAAAAAAIGNKSGGTGEPEGWSRARVAVHDLRFDSIEYEKKEKGKLFFWKTS